MIHVLAEVCVAEVDRFLEVFVAGGKSIRMRHGCLKSTVYRTQNPKILTILFAWSSREDFVSFTEDPLAQESMRAAGTLPPPQFTYLDRALEIDG